MYFDWTEPVIHHSAYIESGGNHLTINQANSPIVHGSAVNYDASTRRQTSRFTAPILRGILLAAVLILTQHHQAAAAGKMVFGWVTFDDTKWPAPYSGGDIPADSLPWDALTHLGLFAANGSAPPQSYYINQFGAFTKRAHESGVFAGITVGGSSDGALVSMVGDPASWDNWITTYLGYVDAHKMDFIEFDFEGSYSATNIGAFFSRLYDSLQTRKSGNDPSKPPYIVLTASLSHTISWSSATIRNTVEFVNMMTYDYNNNAWGRVTFDNSPKSYKYYNGTGGATDSIGSGVNAIAPSMQRQAIRANAAGWPMNKLNVGLDYNGGGWGNASQIRQSTSGTSGGGSNATFANQWSTWAQLPHDSIFFDQIAQAYWARIGTGIYTWLSLPGRDSGVIATRKVVDSMGLGGVCIWNLGNEVWNTSTANIPPGGRGWFFSQIRKHFDFGDSPPPPPPPPPDVPRIKGKVFFDANQNRVLDPGELPIAGRTVALTGPESATALTDSSGTFSFEQLSFGNYSVSLASKPDWLQTLPLSPVNHSVSIDADDDDIEVLFGAYSATAFRFPAVRNWNIVSAPITSADMSTGALFSLGVTPAYSFHGQYVIEDEITPGDGYWIKFKQGHDVWIAGSTVLADTVDVAQGWNFIGSIAVAIPVGDLRTIPTGILSRYVYGYENGSFITAQIEPGKGYWVNTLEAGRVIISNSGLNPAAGNAVPHPDSNLNELVFVSASGERQTIYFSFDGASTLSFPSPPSPPEAVFAARFQTVAGGSMVDILTPEASSSALLPIAIDNARFPMAIEWTIATRNSGAILRTADGRSFPLEGSGRIDGYTPAGSTTSGATTFSLGATGGPAATIPAAYTLEQNYPNPFNGSTVINFSIPEESHIRLELFNVLGERVLTLVDRQFSPGLHTASFHGDDLPTGVFLYRMIAENSSGTRFSSAKKLAHIK